MGVPCCSNRGTRISPTARDEGRDSDASTPFWTEMSVLGVRSDCFVVGIGSVGVVKVVPSSLKDLE